MDSDAMLVLSTQWPVVYYHTIINWWWWWRPMEAWVALIISLLKGGLDDMVIEASNFFTCTVLCKKLYHVQLLRQNGASGLAQGSFCKMTLAHQNARCKYFDEANSMELRSYLMNPAKHCTIAHKSHTCTSAKTTLIGPIMQFHILLVDTI